MKERIATTEEIDLWKRILNSPIRFSIELIKEIKKENEREFFQRKIDLHGYTIQDAWNTTNDFLNEASRLDIKEVVIVTGKSGKINNEFNAWINFRNDVSKCIQKGGSYKIILK